MIANWKRRRLIKESARWDLVQQARCVRIVRIGKFTIAFGRK